MAGTRYITVDQAYFRNLKSRAIGKDGRALDLAAICWSACELTDGIIPKPQVALLAAEAEVRPGVATRLLEHGRWHPPGHVCPSEMCPANVEPVAEHTYAIHDFLAHQQTREHVLAERERWRTKKRDQRARSPQDSPGDTPGESSESPGPEHDHEHELPTQVLDHLQRGTRRPSVAEPISSDRRHDQIARMYGRVAVDKDHPKNPTSYANAATRRIANDPELARFAALFPTAPPDAIAGWLHGDKHSMSYYPRSDELDTNDATVIPIDRNQGTA